MLDSQTLFRLALTLVSASLFILSAYWAFTIRSALGAPIYRRQAFSVAIVGTYFGVLWIFSPFTNPLLSVPGSTSVYAAGSYFVGIIMIFAWIDQSMRVT